MGCGFHPGLALQGHVYTGPGLHWLASLCAAPAPPPLQSAQRVTKFAGNSQEVLAAVSHSWNHPFFHHSVRPMSTEHLPDVGRSLRY